MSVAMRQGRVDVVHMQREAGRMPRVVFADSVEKGADDKATLAVLKRQLHLDRYRCTALLTHGSYQMVVTEGVAGAPEEAREVVRWKLKDQVDFAVDTAAVDLLPIPSEGRAPQVLAAISPESTIAPLVQAFQAAKLPLAAIDLPEVSQRNLVSLFEEAGHGIAALIFDDDEGLLTFSVNGELLVVRHVEITARQLMTADAERRGMLFERIALDVQRSLDNFDRIFSAIHLKHLLVAPIPGVEGFLDYLRANLTIALAPLELSRVMDLGAVPAMVDPLRQFQCLRAIGAALRAEPGTAKADINLYHPRFLRQRELLTLNNVAFAGAVTYLLLAIIGGWAWQEAASRKEAAAAVEAELKSAREKTDAAIKAAAVRKPSPQMLAEAEGAEALLRRREEIARLLESGAVGSTGGFADYLRGFARQTSPGLWLTGFTIGSGGSEMEIRGSMMSQAALPDYIRRLGAEKAFQGRNFSALTMRRSDQVAAPAPASAVPVISAQLAAVARMPELANLVAPAPGGTVAPTPTAAARTAIGPRPIDFVLTPKAGDARGSKP